MTNEFNQQQDIDGDGRTVRDLLSNRKYSIDYYQREYRWQTKHILELLGDLSDVFIDRYDEKHERSEIANYRHYFLGSVILSSKENTKFIVDGQQRLTTLTLLLIYLWHQLEDDDDKLQLSPLIFSQQFGKKSYNLQVDEREAIMDALYSGKSLPDVSQSESVTNISERYKDFVEHFPEELKDNALPFFVDWLLENVHLVEITAYSDRDAYTIFETMNDRGLSLTPADMLKGYLLASIIEPSARTRASDVWKSKVAKLQELGKEEDADAIKSWLRSQYANTIRDRKRGATSGDFDLIGTEFHRWVKNNADDIGLVRGDQFCSFIEKDFAFYSEWYRRLRQAADRITPELECVYYNAQNNFTLQYPVLLAALRTVDEESLCIKKLRVIASYI
ncbi:MAG: DUF262 domain-containing protein, partial [Armatimonadetes bacterium]|nr:DUF262 domain-containing protein [Armatimonadota bacterium]